MRFDVGCQLSGNARHLVGLVGLRFDAEFQRQLHVFLGGTQDNNNSEGERIWQTNHQRCPPS